MDQNIVGGQFRYLLVDAKVLPEVFLKVVEVKRLMAQGRAANLSQATKMAGISRSAFYKYKDCVFPYHSDAARQIATISCELCDEPGVLSSLLGALYESGANIITINQNIPVDGVAPVTVSMRTDKLGTDPQTLLEQLKALNGVVNIRLLTGE